MSPHRVVSAFPPHSQTATSSRWMPSSSPGSSTPLNPLRKAKDATRCFRYTTHARQSPQPRRPKLVKLIAEMMTADTPPVGVTVVDGEEEDAVSRVVTTLSTVLALRLLPCCPVLAAALNVVTDTSTALVDTK